MTTYLWIALGSALGGVARYWSSGFVAAHVGETFPAGTIFVNVLGSFLIGFVATLSGYTTFSSFSLQTLNLVRDGEWMRAGLNIVLSVVLCLVAVWLGHIAAAAVNQMKGS